MGNTGYLCFLIAAKMVGAEEFGNRYQDRFRNAEETDYQIIRTAKE